MERDEILIRSAILHILNPTTGLPVLSEACLEPGSELNDFLRDHIYKIASGDDLKECSFYEDSPVLSCLNNFEETQLVAVSKELATQLYEIMHQNIDIPPADLFIVTWQYQSQLNLALLKMNYREFYVHFTGQENGTPYNDVIRQTAALPSAGTRLSEAALIYFADLKLNVVERKYEVNGVKTNYFSELFLKCHTKLSSKTQLNLVTKAVEQINKKYYEGNINKQLEAKSVIHNDMIEQGAILPETIGEKLFGEIPEIKEEFTQKLEKYNLAEAEVKPQNKATTKKFEKQFLTTDCGIEINIPMEEYNSGRNIEFITNPDGTISVLIKNINRLTSK